MVSRLGLHRSDARFLPKPSRLLLGDDFTPDRIVVPFLACRLLQEILLSPKEPWPHLALAAMAVLDGFVLSRRTFDADFTGSSLINASVISIALTSAIMALRFYAKNFSGGGRWGYDDGLIFAAYVVNLGLCAVGIGEPHISYGSEPSPTDAPSDGQLRRSRPPRQCSPPGNDRNMGKDPLRFRAPLFHRRGTPQDVHPLPVPARIRLEGSHATNNPGFADCRGVDRRCLDIHDPGPMPADYDLVGGYRHPQEQLYRREDVLRCPVHPRSCPGSRHHGLAAPYHLAPQVADSQACGASFCLRDSKLVSEHGILRCIVLLTLFARNAAGRSPQ